VNVVHCPKLACREKRARIKAHGFFITRWNAQPVRRYRCLDCRVTFSTHTFKSTYRQKRPDLNATIYKWYVSGATQRRMAQVMNISRTTVVRKFLFLAREAKIKQAESLKHFQGEAFQFDEMESFEHTRLKPLSIAIAVDAKTRKLLATTVAPFPCKGPRAAFARQKYGFRPDLRRDARKTLMDMLTPLSPLSITTDFHPAYPKLLQTVLPNTIHRQTKRVKQNRNYFHKNRRRNFADQLFALNFVCAKIRHDLSRMARRVWVTTKKPERLQAHLELFLAYHNKYKICG
jgi:transposase-like protein